MRTIHWFGLGLALLTAAGVAIITSDAQAQYIRLFPGNSGPVDAQTANRVVQAINQCWPHPPSTVRYVRLYRGDGADASRVFADVTGESKLTRGEAQTEVRAGRKLPTGLAKPITPVERCEVTGAARVRAVEQVAQTLWPYSFDTWRESSFMYSPTSHSFTCLSTKGAIGISEDAVITAAENGEQLELVGMVEP